MSDHAQGAVMQEAVERLKRMADCHVVDPTPIDALGRFDATYGDLRAVLTACAVTEGDRATYEWRDVADLPPWDEQPRRQFIRLEGSRDHGGVNWHRVYCGIAYIRRLGELDEMLGYRDTDIIQLCDDGDMDLFSATVTHWMPARFPAIPAPVSGSTEGGNG